LEKGPDAGLFEFQLKGSDHMAKLETVPIGELKHRLPAKLLPLVEEYKEKLEKLPADQGGRLTLGRG
jgi:hypothetical protein